MYLWLAVGCGAGSSVTPVAVVDPAPAASGAEPSNAEVTDLPIALPPESTEGEAPPRPSGPPPEPTSLAEAERAHRSGWHDAALAYVADNRSPSARWLEAQVLFAVGRYGEAADAAQGVRSTEPFRDVASTLVAESLLAVGEDARAEELLREVASRPNTYRARIALARHLRSTGRRAAAESYLYEIIGAFNDGTIAENDAEDLTYVAQAAWRLGSVQEANETFRDAVRADPERVETQLAWAELFLEKYDTGHAEEGVRAALAVNPADANAHALMARLLIQQSLDFAAATAYAERALEINPNLVDAHVTLAGIALRDLDFAQATRHLDRAASVHPSSLEEMATRAAMAFLQDDDREFEAVRARILRRHPGYADLYVVLSEYADWEHRYSEIVEMARAALRLDGTNPQAKAALGINLLRLGEETAGEAALREAWEGDRFNVRVFNLLNLYEDVIPHQYEEVASTPFIFRFHREERAILERYVPPMLRRAYRGMVRRYRFQPEGPVRIELFRDPEHFSVRTTGLPNLGVQGVCFGKVVTALSPGAGQFNWGQITWHELAHVFHLQMSRNRVPRWFTEGLAEYETIIARREWRREEDHRLHAAIEANELPALALMNRAFTHARSVNQMMTAYYASSQIVAYLAERFEFRRIVEMLQAWGRGLSTADVFREVLGETVDAVDAGFRAHLRSRLARPAFGVRGQFRPLPTARTPARGSRRGSRESR